MAPSTGKSIGKFCGSIGNDKPESEVNIGTAIGIMRAKFPHADPVAMVQMSDTRKNMIGSSCIGIVPNMREAKYCPVPVILANMLERVLAKITIPIAGYIRSIPCHKARGT